MSDWADASKIQVSVVYKNFETNDIKVIINSLTDWLEDDDGGSTGYEQGFHEIGREVYDDPESGYNYSIVKTEYRIVE